MSNYIGAIDQGTTSTRFIIFDRQGRAVASAQKEHRQIYPQPGWVEHDAEEIWQRSQQVIAEAMERAGLKAGEMAAIGITNQRETTVVWERKTGKPVGNAIVWQDMRVASEVARLGREIGDEFFRSRTGLPLSTYFSALKLRWILENMEGARRQAEAGELLFGNMDTFLAWKLTGQHVTDATNASRTQLMLSFARSVHVLPRPNAARNRQPERCRMPSKCARPPCRLVRWHAAYTTGTRPDGPARFGAFAGSLR